MTDPTHNNEPVPVEREEAVEIARRLYRSLEMQAGIMRDSERTGGWKGAENVARAFERQAANARELHGYLSRLASATQPPAREEVAETWATIDLLEGPR